MSGKRAISDLKASCRRVGRLYPILVDRHGNIIDGKHRLAADKEWPTMMLEDIGTREERLLARLISNVCRRRVSAEEKSEMLGKLGDIYLNHGVKLGDVAQKIVEKTGMSYRWVMKYLPDKYKERPGLGGPSKALNLYKSKEKRHESKVANRATSEYQHLLSNPHQQVLTIKKYANTGFVNIVLEKKFYTKIEIIAQKLNAKPETIISNTLLHTLRKLENMTKQM